MKRTGIFGGTFNPPHLGHRNIADGFVQALDLDRVLIIPSYTPPHKAAPDLASAEDRIAMCRMNFDDPVYMVSDIEIQRQGRSYTYDTLKALHDKGEDDLYFLVGDDMLLYLENWYNPHGILSLTHLVSAVRSDKVFVSDLKKFAEEHFPEEYAAGRFLFIEMDPFEVSSTEIRNKIRAGESADGLLAPDVAAFIAQKGLYNDQGNGTQR